MGTEDMSYPRIFFNFPSLERKFSHGGLTSKKHNNGTQGSYISNFIEIQNFENSSLNPPPPLDGEISPRGSNPQNIKLNYPKISLVKCHQNPIEKYRNFPLIRGEFSPRGSNPHKA